MKLSPMMTVSLAAAAALTLGTAPASAQMPTPAGPYHVLQTAKVGGDGGFDYVYADAD